MIDAQQRAAAKAFAKTGKIVDMKREIARFSGWSF